VNIRNNYFFQEDENTEYPATWELVNIFF